MKPNYIEIHLNPDDYEKIMNLDEFDIENKILQTSGAQYIRISLQPERSKRDDVFVFRPINYPGPNVIDMTPSKECKEYHENSYIQVNVDGKTIHKRCGALNSM